MSLEIQAMIAEMEDMQCIKKILTSWLKEETNNGKESFDTKSCGDVSDIIKDMAEAMKECYEACYYKTVIEAMKDVRDSSYGYNHRHMGNGEFASSGRGHYVRGYNHGPYMDQMPHVEEYLYDPDFMDNSSRGSDRSGKSSGVNSSMGYEHGDHMGNSKDGDIYDRYRAAKRHYHDSKSVKDKANMESHCMTYMNNTLKNLRSIWEEADPSLREKIKKDFGEEMVEILEVM